MPRTRAPEIQVSAVLASAAPPARPIERAKSPPRVQVENCMSDVTQLLFREVCCDNSVVSVASPPLPHLSQLTWLACFIQNRSLPNSNVSVTLRLTSIKSRHNLHLSKPVWNIILRGKGPSCTVYIHVDVGRKCRGGRMAAQSAVWADVLYLL